MAQRTEDFLTIFNELEQYLRDTTKSERNVPFGGLVSRAGDRQPAVRTCSRDLREWADLRNAVVHEHPRGKVIAEITPEALEEFREMVAEIVAPPTLLPRFRRDVRVFKVDDPLIEAVEDLWREDYSQVIVRQEGRMAMLSYAGVTRWMGHAIAGTTIDLSGVTVGSALEYEKPGGIEFLPREATVFDARDRFQRLSSKQDQRLRIIVITEHGDPSEAPLGLVTASDLLSAHRQP